MEYDLDYWTGVYDNESLRDCEEALRDALMELDVAYERIMELESEIGRIAELENEVERIEGLESEKRQAFGG